MRASPTGAAAGWGLVGRVDEIDRIDRARGAVTGGVSIYGTAGVGKSRLAREALSRAAQDGAAVHWVQATGGMETIALGAFAGLVVPDARGGDLLDLMQQSARWLAHEAQGRPLVLAVDDAQWLDPTSAALVLHLVRTGTAFIIVTVRSGQDTPEAIVALWKDGHASRLELEPLDETDAEALVEEIVGGPVEAGARRWLAQTGKGNALYTRELVLAARAGGALSERHGLWQMPMRPAVSASLRELITARMAGLDSERQQALELLAIGEPLRLAELLALADELSLEALERRGLISIDSVASDAAVRLSHPLFAEVIRGALGSLRARAIKLQLAQTLGSRKTLGPAETIRLAHWLLDAGEQPPVELLLTAARAAQDAADPDFAATLASQALEHGAGSETALLLARAHVARSRFVDAETVLASIEGELADRDSASRYVEERMTVLLWGLRRPDQAAALMERAAGWWPDDDWTRRLEPMRLHLRAVLENPGGMVDLSSSLLSDERIDDQMRRQLEPVHAIGLFSSGRAIEAQQLVQRIVPELPITSYSDEHALTAWVTVALESGLDWPTHEARLMTVLRDALRLGDHAAAGLAAVALAAIALFSERYQDAQQLVSQAEFHFERHDTFGVLIIARAIQVGVARHLGDAAAADAALEQCLQALGGHDPRPIQLSYLIRAQSWAAEARGEHSRARQVQLDGAQQLADMPIYAAQAQYEAMRLGAPPKASAAALASLCERTDAPLPQAYAEHAAALAADDGRALLKSSERLEQLGTLHYAVTAAADAAGAFAREGRQDSARRAAARSREIHDRGQGGQPPTITELDPDTIKLSAREREITDMAAQGLTNAEIAARLVLSTRTVESHLFRAMRKLGISDRRELRQ